MAKYTIELSEILKQIYLNKKYTIEEIIAMQDYIDLVVDFDPIKVIKATRAKIFDFTYPIFNESYRAELETKILTHYYTYEIGCETFTQFKFNLYKKMNENMPYYNKLYVAMNKDFDFDINIDFTEHLTGEGTNEANNTTENTLTSDDTDTQNSNYNDRLRESDTPQNQLLEVEENKYLSKYNYNNGDTQTTKTNKLDSKNNIDSKSDGKTTTDTTRTILGTQFYGGSKAKMLKEYMSAIRNIDIDVIDSLKSCFLLVA